MMIRIQYRVNRKFAILSFTMLNSSIKALVDHIGVYADINKLDLQEMNSYWSPNSKINIYQHRNGSSCFLDSPLHSTNNHFL